MVMSKSERNKIQSMAKKIMIMENKIRPDKTAEKLKNKKLPHIYYHIFEDANYHSLNRALEEKKALKGSYSGTQNKFHNYRKAGGKTWDINQ